MIAVWMMDLAINSFWAVEIVAEKPV